ncbi:MAG TPA: CAAX prenyl protease-related protein [Tepidisphaeraceae bacterium]|nr:CAAX prenyl protease-related protein [Tepidisphaeraceae bacterium]
MTAQKRPLLSDDWAYILPMGIFLVFTGLGNQWPRWYVESYMAKTFIVPIALVIAWQNYTKIKWTHLGLGVLIGVIGLVQWVGMDKLLILFFQWAHLHSHVLDWVPVYGKIGISGVPTDSLNPFEHFHNAIQMWLFITFRWACATLVVPPMEELFWRDFLWREIQSPNDFKLAEVGEWDWKALIVVSAFFASVHIQWITAFVWGLMIGLLLIRTRSIGACIVAHAVTNFLLGGYVLWTHDWYFW